MKTELGESKSLRESNSPLETRLNVPKDDVSVQIVCVAAEDADSLLTIIKPTRMYSSSAS